MKHNSIFWDIFYL